MALVKLNSIVSASLVKVDGIAVAGISKILGQTYSSVPSDEDLTTYTEVDSGSEITVTTSKAQAIGLRRDSVSHVSYDFGASYFGNYDIDFEVKIDSGLGQGTCVLFAVSNTDGTHQDNITANDGILFFAYINNNNLNFTLKDYNTDLSDVYTDGGASSDILYCTAERLATTSTVKIYSDSGRTSLVDTLTISSVSTAFRYLTALASRDDPGAFAGDNIHGYTQNFKIITAS